MTFENSVSAEWAGQHRLSQCETLVNRLRRTTEGTPLLFSRQPSTTFGYSSRS